MTVCFSLSVISEIALPGYNLSATRAASSPVAAPAAPATHQALRHLKVGYVSHRHADRNDMTRYYSRSPSLHLQGNWLAAAGFATDTPVVITVEQGQLLIRIVAE
ncbi:SymE family type I addiction module toxin [Pectobacterium brasiliense]|uniref:SymE family type I addiction module toxin n=1 Tax=Pectobacterium brasiliense TaxID=180957 RepID=UPI003F4F5705